MKHQQNSDHIDLELLELIRINRLVRGAIDLAGFVAWYDALSAAEQVFLLYYLHEFAEQAPFNEADVQQALNAAQLHANHPLITRLLAFQGGFWQTREPEYRAELEYKWLLQRSDDERRTLLHFLVFLFGCAEGRSYSHCGGGRCNHWWHRDLLDERVVQDLMNDPRIPPLYR